MVDIPGLNPIPKNLSSRYGSYIPQQTVPFDLNLCGFLTWAIAAGGTAGVLVALIWALSTNEGSNFLRESQAEEFREFQELRDSSGFGFSDGDFNFDDFENQSPGLRR